MARRTELFPVLLGLLENVAGIVFVKIVPLDWDCNSRFRISVDVVIGTMPLENIAEAF